MVDVQLYFIWISQNNHKYWMLAVFPWTTTAVRQKKQYMLTETYKELLGTCIKSEKTAYINTVCTKSASKDSLNCFAIFDSPACRGLHVFSMSFLTCTAPRSSHTNVQKLFKPFNHINKCEKSEIKLL